MPARVHPVLSAAAEPRHGSSRSVDCGDGTLTMANAITVGRLILLFIVIWLIYVGNVQVITACLVLVIIVFASDGLDGWVARKTGSTSTFGAVFDIAGDRVVENALWVIFAEL